MHADPFDIILEALKALLCNDGFRIPSPSAEAALQIFYCGALTLPIILQLCSEQNLTKRFMLQVSNQEGKDVEKLSCHSLRDEIP